MNTRTLLLAGGVAATAVIAGQLVGAGDRSHRDNELIAGDQPVEPYGGTPDVIVFKIQGYVTYTQGGFPDRAYSFGTTSCNIGTAPLNWHANDNQHPVIGQNMYRLAPDAKGNMRLEQIGQSWLKHGFCALDLGECGSCQGTGCISLGVGCSDPYTASRNGSQGTAGPKYQVNATTGFFPYPPASPSYSGNFARRLKVARDDVWPADNPDARYFVEAQYIHPQDSADDAGDSSNNSSHREITFNFAAFVNGFVGDTVQREPAMLAWQAADPDVQIDHVSLAGEGNYFVACRVYDNGNGTWDYEYAVLNMDSDRGAASFSVPALDTITVGNYDFHDVNYHSGDGMDGDFDGTDWSNTRSGGAITWSTSDFASDENANALRWGTMYNYRFTANAGPVDGTATVGHYKSGGDDSFTASVLVPGDSPTCNADVDGDGSVGTADLVAVLANWGDCPGCDADVDGSGAVDFTDILWLLGDWGDCP